mgnify:CR=1 FL=1
MRELFFIFKSLALTIAIVIVFQIKVGETNLEQKTMLWVQSSPLVAPLQEVADGGLKVLRETWKKLFGQINSKFFQSVDSENTPGKRSLGLQLERSRQYLSKQTEKAKQYSKQKAEESANRLQEYLNEEAD